MGIPGVSDSLVIPDHDGKNRYYDRLAFTDADMVDVFIIDKTDSYESIKKIEEYHFFLQSILDNIPIAAKVNDVNDNLNCIYWNKKSEEMF